MDLFSLAATLTLDASSYNSGITSAESKSSKFATSMNKAISVVKKLAGAAVIGKAAKSLKNLADSAAAAGDKIDKQSQALGISRKAYQEWDYILSQSGSSIDSLGTSMKTLNNSILSGKDSVKKLGLSFDDLKGMNMEQQFEAVVRAFQQMPEGAEKSALAVELFGRNGMELLPLLNSTSDTIDQLRQKFADLGIEMTDKQIEAAVNYSDSMDTLKRTFDAVKYAIGAELLPVMTEWADKAAAFAGRLLKAYREDGVLGVFNQLDTELQNLSATMRESGNPLMEALAGIIDGMRWTLTTVVGLFTDFDGTVKSMKESDSLALQALGTALEVIESVLNWVKENWSVVEKGLLAIGAAFALWKLGEILSKLNPIMIVITAIAGLATLIIDNWDGISEFFVGLWESIQQAVTNAFIEVEKWWTGIKESINAAWGVIATWFNETVWQPLTEFFTAAWNVVTKLWDGTKELISQAWNGIATWFNNTVWKPISDFFTEMWNVIVQLWEGTKQSISDAWNGIANWFKRTVWEPLTEFFTSAWDEITKLWTGISEAISGAWNHISNWFNTTVWQPISEKFTSAWDVVTKLWTGISEAISGAWNHIANWFNNTVWKPISDFFDSAWKAIKELWNNPLGAITHAWNEVARWVDENVTSKITGFFNNVTSAIGDAIAKVGEIIKKLAEIPREIVISIKEAVETATHAGGEAIINTVSGATGASEAQKNAWQAGWDFVSGVLFGNAKGDWNVPYDNYPALLHRGELVMTASQARKYRDGEENLNVRQIAAVVGIEVRKALKNVGVYMGADKVADITADRMNDNISAMNTAILHGMGG